MKTSKPHCPIHGDSMILMNGSGWDYDRWLCGWRDNKTLKTCQYEIEMPDSTYSEEEVYLSGNGGTRQTRQV